jgi:hypothetical protein
VSPEPPAPRCSRHWRWAVTGTLSDRAAHQGAVSSRCYRRPLLPILTERQTLA